MVQHQHCLLVPLGKICAVPAVRAEPEVTHVDVVEFRPDLAIDRKFPRVGHENITFLPANQERQLRWVAAAQHSGGVKTVFAPLDRAQDTWNIS